MKNVRGIAGCYAAELCEKGEILIKDMTIYSEYT